MSTQEINMLSFSQLYFFYFFIYFIYLFCDNCFNVDVIIQDGLFIFHSPLSIIDFTFSALEFYFFKSFFIQFYN